MSPHEAMPWPERTLSTSSTRGHAAAPFPVGPHRGVLRGWLGGAERSHGNGDEFVLLLSGKCRCPGCEPRNPRDALVSGGGCTPVCAGRARLPGLTQFRGVVGSAASRQCVRVTLPTGGFGEPSVLGGWGGAAVALSPP